MLYGNAVVGQSGGPTAAINASLVGVIKAAKLSDAIGKLYGMRNGIEGFLDDRLIEISLSEEECDMLKLTPSSALGSCRYKLPAVGSNDVKYERIYEILRKYNIRYFFYIGGNDSMDTVAKLSAYQPKEPYEVRFIGIPKTIDNDLEGTDHTPGFGSAAKYIAVTMREILCDCAVYTTKAVTIVEVMGRDAGWLTASACLAGYDGPGLDYIYLPEVPFDMEAFFRDIDSAFKKHPNVVVAVSEGIRDANGEYIASADHKGSDIFGNVNLSGAGKTLEMEVNKKLGCKVRSIELNLMQRCAAHVSSLTDIEESCMIGTAAVNAALKGATGIMMTFVRGEGDYSISCAPGEIAAIANKVKKVPAEFIVPEGNNVTAACAEYLLPLIIGETDVRYKNGMPQYFRF